MLHNLYWFRKDALYFLSNNTLFKEGVIELCKNLFHKYFLIEVKHRPVNV